MVMKVFYKKQKPKVIQYIKYNHFSKKAFMHELESTFSSFSQISLGTFKKTMDSVLRYYACSYRKRHFQTTQALSMNNNIHKEITRRTHLRNKFICSKTDADRTVCKKICDVTNKKTCRRRKNPFFSEVEMSWVGWMELSGGGWRWMKLGGGGGAV